MTRTAYLASAAAVLAALPAVTLAQSGPAGLTVVTAGSEQALRLRGTTLPRPFGAELVDRVAVVARDTARGEAYYLVRGDKAGACPSRYVVVHDRRGQSPLVSAPFGTCAPGATAALQGGRLIVSIPATLPGGPPVRYAYAQGAVAPLDATVTALLAPEGVVLTCPADDLDPAAAAEPLAATLDRDFPDEFRRGGTLGKLEIAPSEMREIVARLACLSTRPGADPLVFKAATPLFASHRHGRSAFDALDAIRRTPGADVGLTASAAQFAAQMNYFVAQREPL